MAGMSNSSGGLGRRVPTDDEHVRKYPLSAAPVAAPDTVERFLTLPSAYREHYDQGREGACVGFSCSEAMTILNRRIYSARWLWNEAKKIDEWPDTNPGDSNGTSVRAAMDVLRTQGHRRVVKGVAHEARLNEGIAANRWASTIDELRACIAAGVPVVMGTNWYAGMDTPEKVGREHWIGRGELGAVRGGHAFMLEAASDRRQAFRTPNSWGPNHPRCWMSYELVERLLREQGEATVITDR